MAIFSIPKDTKMFVKKGLFFIVLFTWIMLIQGRPQEDTKIQSSEKPEPVSTKTIIYSFCIIKYLDHNIQKLKYYFFLNFKMEVYIYELKISFAFILLWTFILC